MKNPSPTIKRNPPKVTKPGFSVLIAAADNISYARRLATSAADRGKPSPHSVSLATAPRGPWVGVKSLHDRLEDSG